MILSGKEQRAIDPRKEKRYEIKMIGGHALVAHYDAYLRGCDDGYFQRPKRNPYPAGRRHREYERGYQIAE